MNELMLSRILKYRYLFLAFLLVAVGVFVRIFRFGQVPGGLNQDEAFAAYEAMSLMRDGVDSAGYAFPTYFVSWGSGMNVLESYLAIPFFWLFGVSETAFRLPQLILACISLPVFYAVCKRLWSEKIALVGLGLLAISPWHIMLSRWGLESNLAPALLLLGFFFFLKGIEKGGFLLPAALFYGLSLYAYSITWLTVPLMLICFGSYALLAGKRPGLPWVLGACLILALLALPHILFLMIQQGWISEIRTAFLSIPKMTAMRTGEIAISNLWSADSWKTYLSLLLFQTDGLVWNGITGFGMFYGISTVFLVIGAVCLLRTALADGKAKRCSSAVLVLLGFACCSAVCLLLSGANINKTNSLHFFTAMIIAYGIATTVRLFKHWSVRSAIIGAYAVFFLLFSSGYFGAFATKIKGEFRAGVGEAVDYIRQQNYESIAVDSSVYHSQILFYDQTPQREFSKTVVYYDPNATYRSAARFGRYTFGVDDQNSDGYDAYLVRADAVKAFDSTKYDCKNFDSYAVLTPRS